MYDINEMDAPGTSESYEQENTRFIPPSAKRVQKHTKFEVQERIRRETVENIACFISASPEELDERIADLDREWDTERTLELNASILAFSGGLLGWLVDRRWLYLTLGVTGFLAQHAVQGWCPPLPVLRRLHVRTRKEIEQERNALKMLRGDFAYLPESTDPMQQAEELLRIQEQ
ncbi:MAG: hypothetical protein SCH71_06930 [Desulfobulbaceae bacterium]|nr:hypothetical protein [Desulfobulbaceae bacterium]